MFAVDSFEKYGNDDRIDTENITLSIISTSKNHEIFRRIKIVKVKYFSLLITVKININITIIYLLVLFNTLKY